MCLIRLFSPRVNSLPPSSVVARIHKRLREIAYRIGRICVFLNLGIVGAKHFDFKKEVRMCILKRYTQKGQHIALLLHDVEILWLSRSGTTVDLIMTR
jgi:hypothetical protein